MSKFVGYFALTIKERSNESLYCSCMPQANFLRILKNHQGLNRILCAPNTNIMAIDNALYKKCWFVWEGNKLSQITIQDFHVQSQSLQSGHKDPEQEHDVFYREIDAALIDCIGSYSKAIIKQLPLLIHRGFLPSFAESLTRPISVRFLCHFWIEGGFIFSFLLYGLLAILSGLQSWYQKVTNYVFMIFAILDFCFTAVPFISY